MIIEQLADKFDLSILIMKYSGKDYSFCSSVENALLKDESFIFIPLQDKRYTFFDLLKTVFENPNCKGFVLNKKAFEDSDFQKQYHSFMKIYSKRVEVLFLVQNVYNLAYYIASDNSKKYNCKTICVIGTEDTSIVSEMLEASLGNHCRVSASKAYYDCWHKIIEPMLNIDETTDYVVVEAVPERLNLVKFINNYRNKYLLFTKSSIRYMNLYNDLEELSDELVSPLECKDNILGIYTYLDNELINSKIPYTFSNIIDFVSEECSTQFQQDFYYLPRCASIVNAFLKSQNRELELIEPFKSNELMYKEFSYKNSSIFLLNRENLSVERISKSLDLFGYKCQNLKKVVILEHIINLAQYKEVVYDELFSKISKLNPEVLILLNTAAYIHLYKKYNKKTYVKSFVYKADNVSGFVKFLDEVIKNDSCAIYAASMQDLLPIFREAV